MKKHVVYCLPAIAMLTLLLLAGCGSSEEEKPRPRVLISTDIGGTDPDDFQSMIHLLMYADRFEIEGLVSSPYGNGRKQDLLDMIALYEEDLPRLKEHAEGFPDPEALRDVCKQGAVTGAPFKGYFSATEGSDWIISCAEKADSRPLWVLVWGGLEDVAQALRDAPGIKEKIRVYWIGGPNKKWSVNAYAYIANEHPDLWMIEANATYRGWFLDEGSPEEMRNEAFYENFIQGRGAMGQAFKDYYGGEIKMGDTPSLAYVMHGDPDDPQGESWGGRFTPIQRSSRRVFDQQSTTADTLPAYAVVEWRFSGSEQEITPDSACFTMEVQNQVWPGYYLGNGKYAIRYSSKRPEICTYVTSSSIPELDGLSGQFVSTAPWPGIASKDDYLLGSNWYGDCPEPGLFIEEQQGAKTVAKHREAFLSDWAERWNWLGESQ